MASIWRGVVRGERMTLLIIALLLAVQVQWWWIPSEDGVGYLSIARHIARGEVGRLDLPHWHYAPGFSLLIAPTFWFSSQPFLLISGIQFLLALLFAWGVLGWFREHDARHAGLLTLLVMANVSLWQNYRMTLSEMTFMAGIVWSTHALNWLLASQSARQTLSRGLAAVLLLLVTCLTRQVGVFLVGGFALLLALRAWQGQCSWRRALGMSAGVAAPVAVAVLALSLFDHALATQMGPAGKSYAEYFAAEQMSLTAQVVEGVRLRISEVGRLTLPGLYKSYAESGEWLDVNVAVFLVTSLAIGSGLWFATRRRPDPLLLMLPAYTAIYIAWPFDQGTRYMLPALPMLVLGGWMALNRWSSRPAAAATLVLALHLLASTIYWVRDLPQQQLNRHWAELAEIDRKTQSPGEAVVALDVERSLYLMLQYQTDRTIPLHREAEEIDEAVRWVVAPARADIPPGFVRRHQGERLALLERGGLPEVELTEAGRPSRTK